MKITTKTFPASKFDKSEAKDEKRIVKYADIEVIITTKKYWYKKDEISYVAKHKATGITGTPFMSKYDNSAYSAITECINNVLNYMDFIGTYPYCGEEHKQAVTSLSKTLSVMEDVVTDEKKEKDKIIH